MSQQLRTLVSSLEDLGLVPSRYGDTQLSVTPVLREVPFSSLLGH